MVHEAIRCDRQQQLQVTHNRMETFDANGRLISSDLRRFHLRWWQPDEFSALLESLGYVDVRAHGGPDGWISVGHRDMTPARPPPPAMGREKPPT